MQSSLLRRNIIAGDAPVEDHKYPANNPISFYEADIMFPASH